MAFDKVNRRVHLYLALLLLPWFAMYGISSLAIHHRQLFQSADEAEWTELFDQSYDRPVPPDADLEAIALHMREEFGLTGTTFVRQSTPRQLRVRCIDFWNETLLDYDVGQQRLVATQIQFPLDQFLIRMHVRAGFHGDAGGDLWAIVIDVVSVAFLVWVASGLFMWWKITRTRRWGILTLLAGTATFAGFLVAF